MSSLNQDEVRALEDDRVLLSGTINGKRKVSAALLSKCALPLYFSLRRI